MLAQGESIVWPVAQPEVTGWSCDGLQRSNQSDCLSGKMSPWEKRHLFTVKLIFVWLW